jgi:hypothetical protein
MLKIKSMNREYIIKNSGIAINTCNRWKNDKKESKPKDYDLILDSFKTKEWVNMFHEDYETITISGTDFLWLKDATMICSQTGRFTHIYDDELNELSEKLKKKYKYLIESGNWFIRSERTSLKCGLHGIGPYDNFKKIIESVVTCSPNHMCINLNDDELTLYFFPFKNNLKMKDEYRIFVSNGKLTGISTQNVYDTYYLLKQLNSLELHEYIHKNIIIPCNKIIEKCSNKYSTFTFDYAILEDGSHYFIEPNGYGKNYSAGSSLFEWTKDEDILEDTSIIYFLCVNDDEPY